MPPDQDALLARLSSLTWSRQSLATDLFAFTPRGPHPPLPTQRLGPFTQTHTRQSRTTANTPPGRLSTPSKTTVNPSKTSSTPPEAMDFPLSAPLLEKLDAPAGGLTSKRGSMSKAPQTAYVSPAETLLSQHSAQEECGPTQGQADPPLYEREAQRRSISSTEPLFPTSTAPASAPTHLDEETARENLSSLRRFTKLQRLKKELAKRERALGPSATLLPDWGYNSLLEFHEDKEKILRAKLAKLAELRQQPVHKNLAPAPSHRVPVRKRKAPQQESASAAQLSLVTVDQGPAAKKRRSTPAKTEKPEHTVPLQAARKRKASGTPSSDLEPRKSDGVKGVKKGRDAEYWTVKDVCPPLSAFKNDKLTYLADMVRSGPTSQKKELPLTEQDHEAAEFLHPAELYLAKALNLPYAAYLTSKRRIFLGRLKAYEDGTKYQRTNAQQNCRMDVNKASQMFKVFEECGLFHRRWFEEWLPPVNQV